MNRISGMRALVTGASAGIGAACAEAFARQGVHLLLSARRKRLVAALADRLAREHAVESEGAALDVSDAAAVGRYVNRLRERGLVPDILVNNAGKARGLDLFHQGSIEHWDDMVDTNIKGLLYVSRALLPLMVERDAGHVINIGSIAGRWVYPRGAVYNATKFAVWALNEGMNIDLVGTKVRVSSVDPGMTETEFSEVRFDGDGDRAASVYRGTEPLAAEDVADAVVYVANTPQSVNVINLVLMPTVQRHAMVIHREA